MKTLKNQPIRQSAVNIIARKETLVNATVSVTILAHVVRRTVVLFGQYKYVYKQAYDKMGN